MARMVITGATSTLGELIVKAIIRRKIPAKNLAVSVDDVAKAEALFGTGIEFRYGDKNDEPSLARSFIEAPKVLLVTPPSESPFEMMQTGLSLVNAAKRANVGHIYFTGLSGAEHAFLEASRAVEHAIFSTKIPNTIFRLTNYQEDYLNDKLLQYLLSEIILTSTNNGAVNTATRRDLADAIAAVFTDDDAPAKVYTLAAPTSWTYNDLAKILSDINKGKVTHEDMPEKKLSDIFGRAGMPEQSVEATLAYYRAVAAGERDHTSTELADILGRPPMSLRTSIENFLAVKNGQVIKEEEDVPIAPSKRKGGAFKGMDGVPGPPDDIPGPPSDAALLSLGGVPAPPDDVLPPLNGAADEAEDADGTLAQADEAVAQDEAAAQDETPAGEETAAQEEAAAEAAEEAPAADAQDSQAPMDEVDELLARAKKLLADADDLTWTPDISWQEDDPLQDTDWL